MKAAFGRLACQISFDMCLYVSHVTRPYLFSPQVNEVSGNKSAGWIFFDAKCEWNFISMLYASIGLVGALTGLLMAFFAFSAVKSKKIQSQNWKVSSHWCLRFVFFFLLFFAVFNTIPCYVYCCCSLKSERKPSEISSFQKKVGINSMLREVRGNQHHLTSRAAKRSDVSHEQCEAICYSNNFQCISNVFWRHQWQIADGCYAASHHRSEILTV